MIDFMAGDSRTLLKNLRDTMAEDGDGQERLNHIVELVARSMSTEVCSIYLKRDETTLELCATEGLNPDAVHKTRMRVGEGLVGKIARRAEPINAPNATENKAFRYMPETGEEIFTSFLGVPIQRLGEILGVLVVQSKEPRQYDNDEIGALEIVAMVLAEMQELGAFVGEGAALAQPHARTMVFDVTVAQEGVAEGNILLHDPKIVITNPVTDDPEAEKARLEDALGKLQLSVDDLLHANMAGASEEKRGVLEAYRMFAHSRGWRDRMMKAIDNGLAAEVAVEKEQTATRARLSRVPDPYLRDRMHDFDDLSNRLLSLLTGQGRSDTAVPKGAILVARNIGPGELLDYGKTLGGVILEQGSVGSHAAIIARAWAIPMVIRADGITREALNGDAVMIDGDDGLVHLRPDDGVQKAFRDKIAMLADAQKRYAEIREKPAETKDGTHVSLMMNAGLLPDLPSLSTSGAAGVGLFRTELQFLMRNSVPRRTELAEIYSRVMTAAGDKPVVFRTLDIGSDKVLPFMKQHLDEPNPAMGWRAIRLGLDKKGVMQMQLQAFFRAAQGRPMHIMFPFVAQLQEYRDARAIVDDVLVREQKLGYSIPSDLKIGAMLETPSLAFSPDVFFEEVDFVSIGGNDLKQFFYAADRENERVRRRYDTLNVSFLNLIEMIASRCDKAGTPVSFCGEDAGRPIIAACFVAMGLRSLSMRPASIGPVKNMIRKIHLSEAQDVINDARKSGAQSVRPAIREWMTSL
ncbi:MAG: phosphoenolpyruvate--protein phosphotransferase [Pseudomonadota bacterium]